MFHTPAHKNTVNPGAIVSQAPTEQARVLEFRVTLHGKAGNVVTTYRSIAAAMDLARTYVTDGYRVTIEQDFA